MRLYFHDSFHADVDLAFARTRRKEEFACIPEANCRDPQDVGGTVFVTSAGVGINAKNGNWRPYGGVGLGWTFDSQPGGQFQYDGPTLTLYAGLERTITHRFSAMLEYRLHRQYWKNPWSGRLNNIFLTNHQIDLGFGFRPG